MSRYLELPWAEAQYFKKKYAGVLKPRGGSVFIFSGRVLPEELKPYATQDFSHARWLEDDSRGKAGLAPLPTQKAPERFTPRPHQKEAAVAILQAYRKGWPGFLEADKTGLGKTLSTLAGVTLTAREAGFTAERKATLLVVCPKGVMPVWRQTLQSYPSATTYLRVMVLNYQQLNKLLQAPAAAKKAKTSRTKNRKTAQQGRTLIPWNYIIFDEGHKLKNYPSSSTSMAAVSVASLNEPYKRGSSPYVIYSTATPGSSPLNFAVMANWLSLLVSGRKQQATPASWGAFLEKQGFAVKKGKAGYSWISNPWWGKSDDPREQAKLKAAEAEVKRKQRADALRIGQALKDPQAPFIMRAPTDIAGWPEQQFIPLPLELAPEQMTVYQQAWSAFRQFLRLTPSKRDPQGALVQNLRYRQKASLLKVDAMIENIMDFLEAGNQVFISVEFIETLDKYKEALEAKGVKVSELSGRLTEERTRERLKFQRGLTQVALCTIVEGISLHAGEVLPDGGRATPTARVTVLHDPRQNPLDTLQACGRAHRDGQNSLTYFPVIVRTVDEQVVASFVNKQANLKAMLGSSSREVEELEDIFRRAALSS